MKPESAAKWRRFVDDARRVLKRAGYPLLLIAAGFHLLLASAPPGVPPEQAAGIGAVLISMALVVSMDGFLTRAVDRSKVEHGSLQEEIRVLKERASTLEALILKSVESEKG